MNQLEPSEETEDIALTVQEARRYFKPPPSDQTIYRLIWSGKLKVLDQPGVLRIPLSELRKFFGKVVVYKPHRQKTANP
jgi:helix-turn-helix protein